MRRKNFLVLLVIGLMLCSILTLQAGMAPAQAASGNLPSLAGQAVTYLQAQYQTNGAQNGLDVHYPFVLYVLETAGVNVSGWSYSGEAMPAAVSSLVYADMNNTAVPVKYIASDLIAMKAMGNTGLEDQLLNLLQGRQNSDGSFQNDDNLYSIIPAYDLLGRAGKLGVIDAVYARSYILAQQTSNGNWPDFMTTAEAVRALNYLEGAAPNSAIAPAIASGTSWMQGQQNSNGSFQAGMDDPIIDTVEAIATQEALGIDPASASGWNKSGETAVDYLNTCSLDTTDTTGAYIMDATWVLDGCNLLGIAPAAGGTGGISTNASVSVQVEGPTSNLADTTVSVSGSALSALDAAVGSSNVVAPGGFISTIDNISGNTSGSPPTSWFYYVIRNGAIDPSSLNLGAGSYTIENGDQIIFYIGAYDATTYADLTYLPVVSVSPQSPTAGQSMTISVYAEAIVSNPSTYVSSLAALTSTEAAAIGNYTVTVGGTNYTTSGGQATIPGSAVTAGTLAYAVTNYNSAGYPDVVRYAGSISVANASVSVQVEGPTSNLADTTVSVSGSALDALDAAVGSSNVVAPGGFISTIDNVSGNFSGSPPTSWFYYVIRNGAIDPSSLNLGAGSYTIENGDQIIFYIGAYDATTYADLTYLPVVTVSPQSPTAGQSMTISIYAEAIVSNPSTYVSSLAALTSTEAAAIGNYTVTVGGTNYTTSGGQATIPGSAVTAGTLAYAVTNYNSAGYPNVVRYAGSISVASVNTGGGGGTSYSVGVAVVGMNGQMLYGPAYAIVSSGNQWGLTALGALDAAVGSTHYVTTNTEYGIWVTSIDGEAMQQGGTAGWIFTVNDVEGSVGPAAANISSGDHVIWYWSSSMSQAIPTWAELTSGGSTGGGGAPAVTSTTGSATVDPATGGTVSFGSDASVSIPAGALNGTASATVAIQQVSNPPSAPAGFTLLGSVYEFTVSGQASYQFAKDVTLTLAFDPTALAAGETPAIYYYDESSDQWVSLGGTVSGSTIMVTVDHFTKFAVLAGNTATPAVAPPTPVRGVIFTDVPNSFWAYGDIENLSGLGYISGYPDGSFKPGSTITRAEFVSILSKALQLAAYNPTEPDFSDVAQGDWCYGSVEKAVYAGIVKGYSSTFRPDDPITREEMAVILVNALNEQDQAKASMNAGTAFTDDASISDWARGFVAVAVQDGLLKGYPDDNSFRPKSDATRAEACAMIMNFLNIHK